jgi:hypothetical protein
MYFYFQKGIIIYNWYSLESDFPHDSSQYFLPYGIIIQRDILICIQHYKTHIFFLKMKAIFQMFFFTMKTFSIIKCTRYFLSDIKSQCF